MSGKMSVTTEMPERCVNSPRRGTSESRSLMQSNPTLSIPMRGIVDGHLADVGRFLVDASEVWVLDRRWHLDSSGYPCTFWVGVGCQRLHRLLCVVPKGMVVDHINRNKMDNRRINLRIVGQSENTLNSPNPYVANFVAGVCANGHPKTPENVYMRKDRPGKWNCLECRRERRRRSAGGED